jgi:hypothetical protein
MITGGAVIAAGAIWWFSAAKKEKNEPGVAWKATPTVVCDGAGLVVEGSF